MREIRLDKYDWNIIFVDDVAPNSVRKLIPILEGMGMSRDDESSVLSLFDYPNRGFIYTDKECRCSLIAIGWSTSWKQEVNTIAHEVYHLSEHICKGCGLSTDGEPPAYVVSELIDKVCN